MSRVTSGAWRPNEPFLDGRDGLRITLKRERGVTPKNVLNVPFRFQAPPLDRFGRRWEYAFDTFTTVAAGEQARASGNVLERPSLQTMFLDESLRFMVWDGTLGVQRILEELKAILKRPAPFRLTIGQPGLWGPRPLLSMVAVFTSIQPEQRGGEIGTEYADIEFLQWPTNPPKGRRPSEAHNPRRYTLRKGDTLYKIAVKLYKRPPMWRGIAKANGMTHARPDSVDWLEDWAEKHHRRTIKVPPNDGVDRVGFTLS